MSDSEIILPNLNPNPNTLWPPAYSLRFSARAKRISVQISPKHGLQIILPKRKKPLLSKVDEVLQENKNWIQKHLSIWQQEQHRKEKESLLPISLNFPAWEEEILLEYKQTNSKQIRIQSSSLSPQKYILSGDMENTEKIRVALKKILFQKAHHYLIPKLHQLSINSNLPYDGAKIRGQRCLWGSCTSTKKISLNAKLLFLPPELVDYVLIHELCHTRFMNHSARFWNLVKQFDPHYGQHKRALRHASVYLPRWIE